ncbi:MAG: hypothetical protein RLN75_04165 [Longimicrobiales bacterium]
MTTLGMPTSMFLVFAATIVAGSAGAIHYVIWHMILGKPFAEVPPPVLAENPDIAAGGDAGPGAGHD